MPVLLIDKQQIRFHLKGHTMSKQSAAHRISAIREGRIADVSDILRFTTEIAGKMKTALNQKTLEVGVRRFLKEGGHDRYFMAEADGETVGQLNSGGRRQRTKG